MKSALIRCRSFHDTACKWVAPASNDVYSFSEWPAQRIWVNLSESHRGFWQFLAPHFCASGLRSGPSSVHPLCMNPAPPFVISWLKFKCKRIGTEKKHTHHGLFQHLQFPAKLRSAHLNGVSKIKAGSNTGTNHDTPIPWKDTWYFHSAMHLEAIFRLNLPQRAGVHEILRHVHAFAVIWCILDILVARAGSYCKTRSFPVYKKWVFWEWILPFPVKTAKTSHMMIFKTIESSAAGMSLAMPALRPEHALTRQLTRSLFLPDFAQPCRVTMGMIPMYELLILVNEISANQARIPWVAVSCLGAHCNLWFKLGPPQIFQ